MEMFEELSDIESQEIDGGFVSLGFTIAVCVEVFAFVAAETFLYKENKRLEEEMKQYK